MEDNARCMPVVFAAHRVSRFFFRPGTRRDDDLLWM